MRQQGIRSSDRDTAILHDTWRYRYLTARQVARLHFGHLKLAQRRLRILTNKRLLDRFQPTDARRKGFGRYWYRLARSGARTLANHLDLSTDEVLPPTRPPRTTGFLAHHELVTDFRIWLREACNDHPLFTYAFIPNYDELRHQGRRTRRVSLHPPGTDPLIPDGAFTLTTGEKSALFFLELDQGTEPLTGRHQSAITRKLTRYRTAYDHHAETKFQREFDTDLTGFRILCIIPTIQRRDRFTRLARDLDLAPLVWTTTHDLLQTRGDLNAHAWIVSSPTDLHRLSE